MAETSDVWDFLHRGNWLPVGSLGVAALRYDKDARRLVARMDDNSFRHVNGVGIDDAAEIADLPPSDAAYAFNVLPHYEAFVPHAGYTGHSEFLDNGVPLYPHSSNVYSISYEKGNRELAVQFHHGATYYWEDVQEGVAFEFFLAASKGKFVWRVLYGSHVRKEPGEPVGGAAPWSGAAEAKREWNRNHPQRSRGRQPKRR